MSHVPALMGGRESLIFLGAHYDHLPEGMLFLSDSNSIKRTINYDLSREHRK